MSVRAREHPRLAEPARSAPRPLHQPPGQAALRAGPPGRRPREPSPPPPRRSPAQPPSCQRCAARRGYSRSFRRRVSPQLLHPRLALGCPQRRAERQDDCWGGGAGGRAPQLQVSAGCPTKSSVFKNNKTRPSRCARDTGSGERTETRSRTRKSNKARGASRERDRHRPHLGRLPVEFLGTKNARSRPRAHGAVPRSEPGAASEERTGE